MQLTTEQLIYFHRPENTLLDSHIVHCRKEIKPHIYDAGITPLGNGLVKLQNPAAIWKEKKTNSKKANDLWRFAKGHSGKCRKSASSVLGKL